MLFKIFRIRFNDKLLILLISFFSTIIITFINDSKATSFQATKFALQNTKNIFWIVGGLPKLGDKFKLKNLKKNIIKSYIIGKNINYFNKQIPAIKT